MSASKRILLVEGKSDEAFYGAMCTFLGLAARVKVAPPKGLGQGFNNKEGAFNTLPMLLKQLGDGQLERVALVVDADHEEASSLGYRRTVERVTDIVEPFGFERKAVASTKPGGLLFRSTEGLDDFGLWVMPGDGCDGMLENWIKHCIVSSDAPLMRLAERAVTDLDSPKFKELHRIKAEVATWLAWQKAPGRGLEHAIDGELLDQSNERVVQLTSWLRNMYG
jgi:hypothetical protein